MRILFGSTLFLIQLKSIAGTLQNMPNLMKANNNNNNNRLKSKKKKKNHVTANYIRDDRSEIYYHVRELKIWAFLTEGSVTDMRWSEN